MSSCLTFAVLPANDRTSSARIAAVPTPGVSQTGRPRDGGRFGRLTVAASPVAVIATPVGLTHTVSVGTDANGRPIGDTRRVKVTIQPQPTSQVGGAVPQWTSSGWMGVVTASLIPAKKPTNCQFSFDVSG